MPETDLTHNSTPPPSTRTRSQPNYRRLAGMEPPPSAQPEPLQATRKRKATKPKKANKKSKKAKTTRAHPAAATPSLEQLFPMTQSDLEGAEEHELE